MERLHELSRAERIAMETRRAQEIEESHRLHLRFLAKAICACLAWDALGIVLMMWSFHIERQEYADLVFQLSFMVGYGGMFFTAVAFYVRGRETGEFD